MVLKIRQEYLNLAFSRRTGNSGAQSMDQRKALFYAPYKPPEYAARGLSSWLPITAGRGAFLSDVVYGGASVSEVSTGLP